MVPAMFMCFGGVVVFMVGLIMLMPKKPHFMAGILATVGGLSFGAAVVFIIMNSLGWLNTELEYSHHFNIYAIQDTTRIKGSRFHIEEHDRYYYITDYRDGKQQGWVSVWNSYVKEDDTVSPRVEVYRYVISNPIWRWVGAGFYDDFEYKLIVPTETLTTQFNIDLKP